MKELIRALGVLAEPPDEGTARVAEALGLAPPEPWQYDDLFIAQLYPYASVYLGAEGKLGGDARDRVAGVWRALGHTPPKEPDHLAALLGLYGRLVEFEADDAAPGAIAWRGVRAGVLHEHLLSWLPLWLARVEELAGATYRGWGSRLRSLLRAELSAVPPTEELPLQLRSAPRLQSPEEIGGKEFVEQLLAPVRTGMILTRDDLARAGRETGLALRIGERRWVIEAFLSQDAATALDWLGSELRRQATLIDDWVDGGGDFWRARAAAAGEVIERATGQARGG